MSSTVSLESFYDLAKLISGCGIFFMQLGFAMLEAGTVRQKNVTEIIIKNISDVNVAGLSFWAFGYAIAFVPSGNGFAGGNGGECMFMHNINDYGGEVSWFFHWCFVSTCASIVSGAVAERCKMICYISYAGFMSIAVYPVIAYWTWSTAGWLSPFNPDAGTRIGAGVIDFAGSGVVHMTGGMAALLGAYYVGPRADHFYRTEGGEIRARDYTANSQVARAIGVFSLWFGWYFFNGGTAFTLDYASDGLVSIASRTAVNTTISASSGSVISAGLTLLLAYRNEKSYTSGEFFNSLNKAISNGVLAGLVSITGSCAVVNSWGSVIIGSIGSLAMTASSKLLISYEIDDVVAAVPVHLVCGIWGVLAGALFAVPGHTEEVYGHQVAGLFYGGDGTLLYAAALFIVCSLAWITCTMAPFFAFFKAIGLIRYSDRELENIDILGDRHHGSRGGYVYKDALETKNNNKGTDSLPSPSPINGIEEDLEDSVHSESDDGSHHKAYATSARSLDSSTGRDSDLGMGGVEMLFEGNIHPLKTRYRQRQSKAGIIKPRSRTLNPGDIEAYVNTSGKSLDRTNLLALAISHNATDHIMDLLDSFDEFSGGASEIRGAQLQEFIDKIRVDSTFMKLR